MQDCAFRDAIWQQTLQLTNKVRRTVAGKQQRGQQTAEKILQAALKLFSHRALSIERLSEESAVSIGSIYHHFGNLQGVSAALFEASMADLLLAMIGAVRSQATARDKVLAQSRAYIEWIQDKKAAARFIHASGYAPSMQHYEKDIRELKAPIFQELMGLFEPHIRGGDMLRLPLPLYEILLIGPLAELARHWLSGSSGLDMEAVWKILPECIWQSVQPKE
jgi:AcrR family transcriptional regulator